MTALTAITATSCVERLHQYAAPADADARRLAAAVARGDEAAFRELYDRYHDRVFRLALVLGRGDEHLARDLVQTVMLTAARKMRAVKSETHLWHWLARVTRQQFLKACRRQQRDASVITMSEPPELSADVPLDVEQPLEAGLAAALSTLETGERWLIEQFYHDGRSHEEIAAQLNTTAKAVSSRLERLRAKLRALVLRRLSHEI